MKKGIKEFDAVEAGEIASIIQDELICLIKTEAEELYSPDEVLIYADATNGHVTISWYDKADQACCNETSSTISLEKLWEYADENDDATLFDEVIESASEMAIMNMQTDVDIYFQNEVDDEILLNGED